MEPDAIRLRALDHIQRAEIKNSEDVRAWCEADRSQWITVTFAVDTDERLWIADRRSEHVACANGGDVLAAGELTFAVAKRCAWMKPPINPRAIARR